MVKHTTITKKVAIGILAGTMLVSFSPAQAVSFTDCAKKTASKLVKKWQGSKVLRICGYSSLLAAGLLWPIYDAVNIISKRDEEYRPAREQYVILKNNYEEAVGKPAGLKALRAKTEQALKLIRIESKYRFLLGSGNSLLAKLYLCPYLIGLGFMGLKEELWDTNKTGEQDT